MPISVYTEDEIFNLAVAFFASKPKLQAAPTTEASLLGGHARSLAQLLGAVLQSVKDCDYDSLPQVQYTGGVATTPTSSQALSDWGVTLGLPSNRGAGVYGRNGQSAATGGQSPVSGAGSVTGTPGLIIPTGATLTDAATGRVVVKLRAGFTMPGGGLQPSCIFDAVTLGAAGNLPVGTTLRWTSPPPGLTATCALSSALAGGVETETDIALALRILDRLSKPPKGGTAQDFRVWSESAVDTFGAPLGIVRAYVFPIRRAVGSVSVVPLLAGAGTGRDPGATIAAQLLTYLNTKRIATDTVYVERPSFPADSELTIICRVSPAAGYAYDWLDSSSTGVAVASVSTNTIVLSSLTPADLALQITAGAKPRVQLKIAGQALPTVLRATAYVNDSPMAGQATITLESAPVGTPTRMFAAGSGVMPIAIALLNSIDAIGPSTQSGFGDPDDLWSDVVSVGALAQVALETVGTDGRKCVRYVPNAGADPSASVGISIAVGGGAAATADVEMVDNVPNAGPQIPVVASILVVRA